MPMRKVREWILRFGGLFNKRPQDRELDDEIESHLQLHIEANLRLGMTLQEARRQALIKLVRVIALEALLQFSALLHQRDVGGAELLELRLLHRAIHIQQPGAIALDIQSQCFNGDFLSSSIFEFQRHTFLSSVSPSDLIPRSSLVTWGTHFEAGLASPARMRRV